MQTNSQQLKTVMQNYNSTKNISVKPREKKQSLNHTFTAPAIGGN